MSEEFDIVVIGAGFSGIYALHRLKQDYSLICFEAGDGVGGTWYWNRYPGARVDIQSVEYSYSFDKDLEQEWSWPEYFSAQPDLERYANHVAERHELKDMIRFSQSVTSLRYDEDANRWHVHTDRGDHVVCRYVIAAVGMLYAPNFPDWPGREDFSGEIIHTTRWPDNPPDFADQRVGIVGTGSTSIQAAPILAQQAKHLTVFQRTPAFSMPSGNREMDAEFEQDWKTNYTSRREEILETWGVSSIEYPEKSALECTPEEREEILEKAWQSKSAFQMMVAFSDVMTDLEANEIVAEFMRNKIRQTVDDPETAELLCPRTYPLGSKRLCIDNGYYEMYNRDNVSLVDVRSDPVAGFTKGGLITESGTQYDLDVIVLATGFDAITGSMSQIDITGRDGQTLKDKWADGPTSYFGLTIAGFPNLFMIHGPLSPGALAQMITSGEWQVDHVARMIDELEQSDYARIEATEEAERGWAAELDAMAGYSVYAKGDSWYNGKNIAGKKSGFMVYVGGFPRYRELNVAAIENDYEGYIRS